jgi:uncharacterized circularly permuted ATP-grasp superfamily protein
MPRIIKYYLSEDAILPNVQTNICREKAGLDYTLANLDKLVTKPVGESGGYGITIGPRASKAELEASRELILKDPSNWISQPMISLSVAPTLTEHGIRPRHLDLRPFAVTGKETWVLPGGLTRVALKEGSMIVNSSQGGGSKDTWVLDDGQQSDQPRPVVSAPEPPRLPDIRYGGWHGQAQQQQQQRASGSARRPPGTGRGPR